MKTSFTRANLTRAGLALLSLSILGGCEGILSPVFNPTTDPLTREGLWHPDHANRADLVAQVANPTDLVHGVAATSGDGLLATAAITRLHADKTKALASDTSTQGN